ncbi:MAG: dihydrolipoyllysine-residue succinyltransferase, partial [Waddliaceae bacterium]
QVLYAPQKGEVTLQVSTDDVVKIGQVIGTIDSEGIEVAKKPEVQPEPVEEASIPAGPGTRFSKEDFIEEVVAKEAPPPQPTPIAKPVEGKRETRQRMTKIRRIIADRLVEAQKTSAMLTTFNEVDLSEVIALRAKYKDYFSREYGTRLGFMSFFVKASVSALGAFPGVNSYIDGEEMVHREYYDIGIAVGTERGLVVPVVRDCDRLSFAEIEKAIEDYAKKGGEGTLSVDDLQGGGFTITNGGVFGSLLSTPILNPPQRAILGMHKIEKRPVVVDDEIVVRPMMYLALSYDHRIIDGKEAVSFLVHMKNCLEDPARLLLGV